MAVARPGRQYEQEPRVARRADLVAFVRGEDGGEPGAAVDCAPGVAHLYVAVDDDQVRALVDLVLLERLARGQVDGDRSGLAARRVQDARLVRNDVQRAQVPVLHGRDRTPLSPSWSRRVIFGRHGGLAQPRDGLADEARDMHLGDADPRPDLGLREVLREAQAQHLALAVAEGGHQALDGSRVLGDAEAGILGAHRLGHAVAVLVVVARAVEGDGAIRPRGLARLQHLLRRGADVAPDLGRRRSAPELARQLLGDALDADRHLLEVAGHANRPAAVAEVALELAEDRRHRERGERRGAVRLEAVDGLEQAERGDLDEVVERLAAALVAAREVARQRQGTPHPPLAPGG